MRIRSKISSKKISENDQEMAAVANAMAHPLRLALIRYLGEKDHGEGLDNATCNKELVERFDYSQSTMSQHVKVLVDCGLFRVEPREQFRFYFLNRELLLRYSGFLADLGIVRSK